MKVISSGTTASRHRQRWSSRFDIGLRLFAFHAEIYWAIFRGTKVRVALALVFISIIETALASPDFEHYPTYPLQTQAAFSPQKSAKTLKVAYLPPATEFNYYLDIGKGIIEEAKHQGMGAFLLAPQQDDPKEQLAMLRHVISERVDIIILSTHDEKLLAPSIKEAISNGIIVIIINSDTRKFATPVHAIVGYPQRKGTFKLGNYATTLLSNEPTLVGIIEGEPGYHSQERVQGFEQAIRNSNLRVVARENGHWNTEGGFAATLALLKNSPKIGLIFASNDFEILGAKAALTSLGRNDVILLGNDGVPDALSAIDNSEVQATVFTHPRLMGKIALQTSIEIRNGVFDGGYIETPIDIVDKSNVQEFIVPFNNQLPVPNAQQIRILAEPLSGLTNEDGSGLYWDIFRSVYEPEGIQVRAINVPLKRARARIKAQKADIMLGHNRSSSNGIFFPQWHYASQQVVAVSYGTAKTWEGQASLTNTHVAWVRGEDYIKYLSVPVNQEVLGDYLGPLRMLSLGRIDYFLGDAFMIEQVLLESHHVLKSHNIELEQYAINPIFTLKLYPAFTDTPRGRKMAEIFDRKIPQMLASGELKALYKKWNKEDFSF